MEDEAVELRLWAENDGATYKRTGAALELLAAKMLREDYSPSKACAFLADVLKDAAKSYEREFMTSRAWKTVFPRWVRMEAADAMLASLYEEVQLGNMPSVKA